MVRRGDAYAKSPTEGVLPDFHQNGIRALAQLDRHFVLIGDQSPSHEQVEYLSAVHPDALAVVYPDPQDGVRRLGQLDFRVSVAQAGFTRPNLGQEVNEA